jgi:hypothetical protein
MALLALGALAPVARAGFDVDVSQAIGSSL